MSQVYRPEHVALVGARLLGVSEVPFRELAARMAELEGYDNDVDLLRRLSKALAHPSLSLELLGLDRAPENSTLLLQRPDGTEALLVVPWSVGAPGDPIFVPSNSQCPPLGPAQISWGFLDEHKRTAILRVGELMHYREAFEVWRETGYTHPLERRYEEEFPGGRAPTSEDLDRMVAQVPSATELLQTLFTEMRSAHTKWLLVDLRSAPGGNSAFAAILGYFLFGLEALIRDQEGYQIRRYSPLYLENYGDLPDGAGLGNGGYDFREESEWYQRRSESWTSQLRDSALEDFMESLKFVPTFASAVAEQQWSGAWTPQVVVVTSAWTYSAGFDVAAMLIRHGAVHVGVPSSQAGNCFIDTLRFQLTHSRLAGTISFKKSLLYPEDPESGALLRPRYELTYQHLCTYGFDPHASLSLALELIDQGDLSQ
ncbi:MAG: S41 family peptidase [Thermaerobacter sp.]|nr:S41 family peptidase [Thermaerobacter sp.]